MAEGMVGWIQLLGEQYCFAVIVCTSTCSGFPGLGPLASYPMSRYTTIFCLLAITPSTTMTRTETRMRMRTRMKMTRTRTKTRTSTVRTAACLVDLGIHESRLRPSFCIDKTSNWIGYVPWFLALTLFSSRESNGSSARATSWDFWRRWWNVASGADSIPTCPGAAPWREIKMDVSICLSILPPIYLSICLSICIYLHLSVDPCRFIYSRSSVHLWIFTNFDASFRQYFWRNLVRRLANIVL